MGAAQAAYGQAGLPAGAPAVELVTEITQPLKEPIIPPPSPPPPCLLPPLAPYQFSYVCVQFPNSQREPQAYKHNLFV